MNKIEYRGLSFEIPLVGTAGTTLFPQLPEVYHLENPSLICSDTNSIWDLKKFETESRIPIIAGQVADKKLFSQRCDLRILDMPVKFPGSHEYRIPNELMQFIPTMQACIDHYTLLNPLSTECFAYVTVDQGPVKCGQTQRNPGCHVDGFQGARIFPKVPINQSYICCDSAPTVFYPHRFQVSDLDPAVDDFFAEFDRQAVESKAWHTDPYNLVLMDAYCVHRSQLSTEPGIRTFFRLTFERRIFDRLGNTHNPMFDYSWEMVARDVHSTLRK